MRFSAAELATRLGLAVHGDPDVEVSGVATLARATASDLAFLANPRYRAQLGRTGAGVFLRPVQSLKDSKKLVGVPHIKADTIIFNEIGTLRPVTPTNFDMGNFPAARIFERIGK